MNIKTNVLGHMTKMTAVSIYGNNLLTFSSPERYEWIGRRMDVKNRF